MGGRETARPISFMNMQERNIINGTTTAVDNRTEFMLGEIIKQ